MQPLWTMVQSAATLVPIQRHSLPAPQDRLDPNFRKKNRVTEVRFMSPTPSLVVLLFCPAPCPSLFLSIALPPHSHSTPFRLCSTSRISLQSPPLCSPSHPSRPPRLHPTPFYSFPSFLKEHVIPAASWPHSWPESGDLASHCKGMTPARLPSRFHSSLPPPFPQLRWCPVDVLLHVAY